MINNVVLVGRLTNNIELKKTPAGASVCEFRVACDRGTKREDGTKEADFINCVAWNTNADNMHKYAKKGEAIALQGRIQTGSYKDKEGRNIYTTKVLVDRFRLIGSKQADTGDSPMTMDEFPSEERNGSNEAELPF